MNILSAEQQKIYEENISKDERARREKSFMTYIMKYEKRMKTAF